MADFDWQDKRLAHLTQINVADTLSFLSLWEINNPITFLDLDNSAYGVKVEAFPDYPQRITSYKECKKGLIFVGFFSAENVNSLTFQNELKHLILQFFYMHPGIIKSYNQCHPKERIIMT